MTFQLYPFECICENLHILIVLADISEESERKCTPITCVQMLYF